ncbi:hypothetical protein BDV59DRAFT_210124 [Aspergillus ambiguus]|uniref:uncharacterized protein n=1 Tax=Aspergillus ambiguus TaxID=176160 RepID=UPI003CCD4E63
MGEEGNASSGARMTPDVRSDGVHRRRGSSSASQVRQLAQNPEHHPGRGGTDSSRSRDRGGQQQSSSQARNFEFVLVTDNESRRQVRRHAMRQYMHQRRLDSIARLGTSRAPVGGWTARPSSSSQASGSSSKVEEDESPEDDVKKVVLAKGEATQPAKDTRASVVKSNPRKIKREDTSCPPLSEINPSTAPVYRGNGGSKDPFSSYPIEISNADHQLIQHFVVTYPSMMYKFVNSLANNPMVEIFRQFALHDELPFQAMLAIASKHRAGVEGKKESVQSLTHKMRALRLMNERIQTDSTGQLDGTIYAVATMAVIEDSSIERMHFRGLASMIRYRGGMQGMRLSSPFLEKVIYWVDFSCAPKAIVSTSLPWTGSVPDACPSGFDFLDPDAHLAIPHHLHAAEGHDSLCDQYRACEDFLRFFRRLHALETALLNSPPPVIATTANRRPKRFVPNTPLYSVLTMLPDYDHGIRDIRFIDEYTAMACLFFLAVVLYDCYASAASFDPYLDWLHLGITKMNPYATTPSITAVLWLFLGNGGYPAGHAGDRGDRCWVVSRMVRIAKRLEWKRHGAIWDRLRQVLVEFILTQQECALGSDHVDDEAVAARLRRRGRPAEYFWDEDEMRQEILGVALDVPILT